MQVAFSTLKYESNDRQLGENMSGDIQLIGDDDGMAVIGDLTEIERFLSEEHLSSKALDPHLLNRVLRGSSKAAQKGAEIAQNSGRWVKLTEESAKNVKRFGLMRNSTTGLSMGVVTRSGGKIHSIVQFEKGAAAMLSNPAFLTGVAGIMAQVAMQQTIKEITDYLAAIDEKVDDIIRGQKDAILAGMIGAELLIKESMTIREQVRHVSETTWSKIESAPMIIATTQAYALRRLDALAEKIESTSPISQLAEKMKVVRGDAREWLAVLACCFKMQDEISVLELDRVLQSASDEELENHRHALTIAHRDRARMIVAQTDQLLLRIEQAAQRANDSVLLTPLSSHSVIGSSKSTVSSITDFRQAIGKALSKEQINEKAWLIAAAETKDKALEIGAAGINKAAKFGAQTTEAILGLGGASIDATHELGVASVNKVVEAGSAGVDKVAQVGAAGVDKAKELGEEAAKVAQSAQQFFGNFFK